MTNFLTPHWEYPACVRCAECHEPLTLTWSSSAVGHGILHADCRLKRIDAGRRAAQTRRESTRGQK